MARTAAVSDRPANLVKQMVRWLSKTAIPQADGIKVVQDVDDELSTYLRKGYELFATHYLGENPEAFGVMYVLVYKDPEEN